MFTLLGSSFLPLALLQTTLTTSSPRRASRLPLPRPRRRRTKMCSTSSRRHPRRLRPRSRPLRRTRSHPSRASPRCRPSRVPPRSSSRRPTRTRPSPARRRPRQTRPQPPSPHPTSRTSSVLSPPPALRQVAWHPPRPDPAASSRWPRLRRPDGRSSCSRVLRRAVLPPRLGGTRSCRCRASVEGVGG